MAVPTLQIPQYQQQRDLDFSSLAQLPQTYQTARNEAVRRQTLAELGQGGQIDPMQLIQSGDMNLANLGIGLMNRQQEQARQDKRYAVEDARSDRNFNFQREQAQEKPTIQKVKDAAGNESLVQVYPDGRTRTLNSGEAAGGTGANNPFAPDGKQTNEQANAGLYAGRMFQAEKILRDPKIETAAQSTYERIKAKLPGAGESYNLNSNDYQKFDQAQRNFINAVLRRESGAVISPDEFDNARKQYFPAPGDTPDRIAQKRANRQEAIRGIAGAAGPAWRAPATFDEKGELQDRAPSKVTGITEEAYRALPKGATYTAPDGSTRTKR